MCKEYKVHTLPLGAFIFHAPNNGDPPSNLSAHMFYLSLQVYYVRTSLKNDNRESDKSMN